MNIAIIGSGGREHAICQKIHESKIKKIYCIPGNGGTQKIAENIKIDLKNFEKISLFLIENNRSNNCRPRRAISIWYC